MYSLLILAICSFGMCAVLTLLTRNLCLRFRLVDQPDKTRKFHRQPIPRLGGVAIAITYVSAFAALLLLGTQTSLWIAIQLPVIWGLLPAAVIVFFTGVLDDIFNIKPAHKFAGQAVAAIWAYFAGIQIGSVVSLEIPQWLSFALTVLWLVGCSNAFNLIDGMDGLAAGLGFFAAFTMLIAAVLQENFGLALAVTPLVGCLLAFLLFNFNPASIFLGDSGSLLIGFLLGCFAVVWMQKTATVLGIVAPLMALAVPLVDMGLAVVRRFLRHRPIFSADRGHIHHILLDRGLTPRNAALLLYGVAFLGACLALVVCSSNAWAGMVLIVFCLALLIGVRRLGLVELDTLQSMIVRGTFRHMVDRQIAIRSFEQALAAVNGRTEIWELVRLGARDFGFARVRLLMHGFESEDRFREVHADSAWLFRVPLGESSWVEFEHDRHYMSLSMIGPFVDVVARQLQMKQTAPVELPARSAVFEH
jgi:UDP-GlcNAc:undecaprenyl-phosphate GlcNAc-1-phosphate transferase